VETVVDRDPWWTEWDGEEYLAAYRNRDEHEAHRRAAFVSRRLASARRVGRVAFLDLAFGTGRHAAILSGAGGVAGVDTQLRLLGEAHRNQKVPSPGCTGADARHLPFRGGVFGAAVSFFGPLGRQESAGDDEVVLREVRRVLSPGGIFLASLVNAGMLLATLVTQEEKTIAGKRVSIRRWYRSATGRLEKEIRVGEGPSSALFRDSIRVYAVSDLVSLFRRAGFSEPELLGDFDGRPFRPLGSPRIVLLAVRADGA